jgi:hypothetical protein
VSQSVPMAIFVRENKEEKIKGDTGFQKSAYLGVSAYLDPKWTEICSVCFG